MIMSLKGMIPFLLICMNKWIFPFDSIFKFNSLVISFWKSPYIADIIINLLSEPSMRRAYSNNKGMINLANNLLSFSFLNSITNLSLFLSVIINEKVSLIIVFNSSFIIGIIWKDNSIVESFLFPNERN